MAKLNFFLDLSFGNKVLSSLFTFYLWVHMTSSQKINLTTLKLTKDDFIYWGLFRLIIILCRGRISGELGRLGQDFGLPMASHIFPPWLIAHECRELGRFVFVKNSRPPPVWFQWVLKLTQREKSTTGAHVRFEPATSKSQLKYSFLIYTKSDFRNEFRWVWPMIRPKIRNEP